MPHPAKIEVFLEGFIKWAKAYDSTHDNYGDEYVGNDAMQYFAKKCLLMVQQFECFII